MKDFLTLAAQRYSVRKFTGEPVSDEHLSLILKAGHLAPTACNNQPQKLLVIRSREALDKLYLCTRCHFNCPTAIIICNDSTRSWTRKTDGKSSGDVDTSIVTTHMMMEAADLGVGTCWLMLFKPDVVRAEFNLPDHLEPVSILVMGYPAEDADVNPLHNQFRPEEDIVTYL